MNKGGGNMFAARFLLILMVLSLFVVLVPACGSDDGDDDTPSAASQSTTITQPTSAQRATTPTSDEPVKIGVLIAWSGAAAMLGAYYVDSVIKVIEKQVEDMGGILGGRPVEFVRYDTGGTAAGAAIGAQKLVTKDKVCALAIGGVDTAEASVIADVAEEEKLLFASLIPLDDIADREYMVLCSVPLVGLRADTVKLLSQVLTPKPQTAGVMFMDDPTTHDFIGKLKQELGDAGIETVYEEYIVHGVMDFSPYLTKVKHGDRQANHGFGWLGRHTGGCLFNSLICS